MTLNNWIRHYHTQYSFPKIEPSSFSFVKMSSPAQVHSGAWRKTALRFPSKMYLKTSSWAEFNISVDSSNCKAYFPFLTLYTSCDVMSWAMLVMHRAIVPLDSGTSSRSQAYNLSLCMARYIAKAAGLINVSPIVSAFFACAINYAYSYEALRAAAGLVCLVRTFFWPFKFHSFR